MARTTLDLDPAVLDELKRRRTIEGKTLGVLASELLTKAFRDAPEPRPDFVWNAEPMGLRVDLEDKDAVWAALDEP